MTYCKISQTALVEVSNYNNLRAAWRMYGATGVVGSYKVTKPLTGAQMRRLPIALRAMLIDG